MRLDLDTEDRFIRYKMAMECVMELVGSSTTCASISPGPLACLLHVLHDDLEQSVTVGGRPPRAVNDLDGR